MIKNLVVELKNAKYLIIYAIVSFIVLFPENLEILGYYLNNELTKFLITILLGVIYFCYYFVNKPHYGFKEFAIASFIGSFPAVASLISISLFAIYTSWLADFWKEKNLIDSIITGLYLFFLPFAFLLSIPEQKRIESKTFEPKKVLIFPLSTPNKAKAKEDLLQQIKEKNISHSDHNWAQIFVYLKNHMNTVEKIFILKSEESNKDFGDFKELLNEFEKVYKENNFPSLEGKIEEVEPIDFNCFEDISDKLSNILKNIKKKGYKDEDISVFISPGTSLVTLVLTLFAIKEGRQVEYNKQHGKKDEAIGIIAVNVSIRDLYDFYPELRK